ncbi:MAG TPA: hypothetical protein VLH09_10755, partial [Bryobacteraceae bacterium]|nr:hypothetical protein [Bryobacteraceae bacterium]
MLTKQIVSTLSALVRGAYPDQAAQATFLAQAPEAQLAGLLQLTAPANPATEKPAVQQEREARCRAFVVLLSVKTKIVTPGTPAYLALRTKMNLPDPAGWPLENPPTTVLELISSFRDPNWMPIAEKLGVLSSTLSYEDCKSKTEIAAAILNRLELGGLEDIGDPRSLLVMEGEQFKDPTMAMLVSWILGDARIQHPLWFGADGAVRTPPPDGVDLRSTGQCLADKEAEREKAKLEARRKQQAEMKAKVDAEYAAIREKAVALVQAQLPGTVLNDALAQFPTKFEDLRNYVRSAEDSFPLATPGGQALTAAVAPLIPEDDRNRAESIRHLAWQVCLSLISHLQPTWFRVLSNTDLSVRPQPLAAPRPKSLFSRAHRSLRIQIRNLVRKHGIPNFLTAADEIFDLKGVLPAFASQAKPVEGDEETEAEAAGETGETPD